MALARPEHDAVSQFRSSIRRAEMVTYSCETEVRQREYGLASGLVLRQLEREILIKSDARQ